MRGDSPAFGHGSLPGQMAVGLAETKHPQYSGAGHDRVASAFWVGIQWDRL